MGSNHDLVTADLLDLCTRVDNSTKPVLWSLSCVMCSTEDVSLALQRPYTINKKCEATTRSINGVSEELAIWCNFDTSSTDNGRACRVEAFKDNWMSARPTILRLLITESAPETWKMKWQNLAACTNEIALEAGASISLRCFKYIQQQSSTNGIGQLSYVVECHRWYDSTEFALFKAVLGDFTPRTANTMSSAESTSFSICLPTWLAVRSLLKNKIHLAMACLEFLSRCSQNVSSFICLTCFAYTEAKGTDGTLTSGLLVLAATTVASHWFGNDSLGSGVDDSLKIWDMKSFSHGNTRLDQLTFLTNAFVVMISAADFEHVFPELRSAITSKLLEECASLSWRLPSLIKSDKLSSFRPTWKSGFNEGL